MNVLDVMNWKVNNENLDLLKNVAKSMVANSIATLQKES